MSADIADRLRALARDHLDGRSSLGTYRRLRAQLLDGLVAAAEGVSSVATQPRPAAPLGDVTQPRAAMPRAAPERSEPAAAPAGNKARPGLAAAYVVLGLGVILAVLLSWRHHAHGLAPQSAATSGATDTGQGGQSDPIRALLEPLLQNPDWSDARLLALNQALLEAGQPQLDAARNTDWFDAFVASVRSRLLQQQALAGAPLTPDNSPLAALAVTLGIDLAAPRAPMPQKSDEKAAPARGATASGAAPRAKRGSSVPPAQVSRPASTHLTSAAPHAADITGAAQPRPPSSHAGHAGSASAPSARSAPSAPSTATTSLNPTARTSAPHEYPACAAALSQVRLNYCQDFLASGEPGPLLAVIPAGSFMMGESELAAEGPVHRVTIAYDFAMSVYEVSQSEFQLYCRTADKECPRQPWKRGDYPVVNVSWQDAQDYAHWLSLATHQRYRLPTEAEWEYAARAGETGLYPSGDSLSPTDAYFSVGATLTAPAPRSMRFNANAWHLMHMVGNAREWVADDWSPNFSGAPVGGGARSQGEPGIKVVRGGCYADQAVKLRLTTREPLPADTRDRCTGIRLVRELSP
jgi:formylglycine-generating enzyme required for sulfatase activity